eukprot:UN12500
MLLVWFMILGGFEIPPEETVEEAEDEEVRSGQDARKSESVSLSWFEPTESLSMSCTSVDEIHTIPAS